MGDKIKVLYIAGEGRSGSTIIANILGQAEGFVSVGEMHYVWDRGVLKNWPCGCGTPFHTCPFWNEVFGRAFQGIRTEQADALLEARRNGLHSRHLLLPSFVPRRIVASRMQPYLEATEKLYRSIRDVSGARVIIDGSKIPSHHYILEALPSVELYTLHLVRDPRAVAYSWWKRKKMMFRAHHHPLKIALRWHEWNWIIEKGSRTHPQRYMLFRYEDFIREPRKALDAVLEMLGEEAVLPFVGEYGVELGIHHTVSGNSDRFQTGFVEISPDQQWKGGMGAFNQALVTMATWPMLKRYRYDHTRAQGQLERVS